MAVAGFKPVLGALTLSTAGFTLAGDNAGFCDAILRKTAGGQTARLESLTYVLPGQMPEPGGGESQPPMVVNLLMQLRASCNQSNIFLRTGQASQAQIMAQLRQTLARSDRTVRARAGEIERAVRSSLFQENEFRQALARLEREVKKNGDRPGQVTMPARSGQRAVSPKPQMMGRIAGRALFSAGPTYIQARPGGDRQQVIPPPDRPAAQPQAQPERAGYAAMPDGPITAKIEGRGQLGVFGASERKTEAQDKAQQNGKLSGALTVLARTEPVQETVSERPTPRGEVPQKADRTTGRTDKGPHPVYQPSAAADGQKQGGLPSSKAPAIDVAGTASPNVVWEGRQLPLSYEFRGRTDVEKMSKNGGRWKFLALSPLHPAGAGFQANIFRVLQNKTFPLHLHFRTGTRGASSASMVNQTPISSGNRTLRSLNWLLPVLPADSNSTSPYANGSSPDMWTMGPTIYPNRRGQEAVLFNRNGPNQRPAEHRMRNLWLAAPGSFFMGGDREIHFPRKPIVRSGMVGETILRWFGIARTSAESALTGQKNILINSSVSGFAARLSSLFGGNVRFNSAAAPVKLFRTWDKRVDLGSNFKQERGKNLPTDFRFASASGEYEFQTEPYRRLAAATAADMTPVLPGNKTLQSLDWLWLSMAQADVGTVPAGRGNLPSNNRISGFAARLSPPYGRNVRFDSAAVPAKPFRIGDKQVNSGSDLRRESGNNLPTGFRPALISGEYGFHTELFQRFASDAAAVPERNPAGYPVSARSAPDFLRSTMLQAKIGTIRTGNNQLRIELRGPLTRMGWPSVGTKELQTEPPLAKAERNTASSLPGLAHFASPLGPLEGTLSDVPSSERRKNAAKEGGPAIIFRSPAPPAGEALPPQEQEGESVLAAQTVASDQVRAMNRAFSYLAPAPAGRTETRPGAQLEQSVTAAGQETRDINYNRLTEEILVRIERRLRAERRKFGL